MNLFDETPEPETVRAERAALYQAMVDGVPFGPTPESEARGLLDRMLEDGATFTLIQVDGRDRDLIWFGSAATVTPEVRADVARLKPEIIRLFLGGYPQSRRTWGKP